MLRIKLIYQNFLHQDVVQDTDRVDEDLLLRQNVIQDTDHHIDERNYSVLNKIA